MQKVLETANIKLSSVATDVLGKSGRDMLSALIEGTTDAEILAELARGKLRKQLPQLQQALDGRVQAHHRLLLKHLLAHIIFLEETLEQLQQEIEQRLCPFEETMTLLMSIPGIAALEARGYSGRNWRCYDAVPFRQASRVVGSCVPRQQAKWGQTAQRQDDPRQCDITGHSGRSGLGPLAHER